VPLAEQLTSPFDVSGNASIAEVTEGVDREEVSRTHQTAGTVDGSGERMQGIVRSKVEPPPLRATTLTRHRLLEGLPANGKQRVTLVVAEAGFGKTTLLADFSRRYLGRTLWYRLDETDADWVTLVNYLVAATRQVVPGFGDSTSRLLKPMAGASPPKELVLSSLLAELDVIGDQPTALIFDDFQAVDGSADATEVMMRLIRDAPPTLELIISSRRRPSLPLAKWSASGRVQELSTEDLRFSQAEIARLFAEAYGQPLDGDVIEELDRRTHGWAVSLQLFHSIIQGRSSAGVRSMTRLLSGATSPVYEFLAEEVLDQLPGGLEDFALRASILDAIIPAYVVALLDPPGVDLREAANLIEDAERAGLISRTSQLGGARQFHRLLREFLMLRLSERYEGVAVAAMHARVAEVAETQDVLTACHHYIEAGMLAKAMDCLAGSVIHTMGSGRWGAASALVERLPVAPAHPAVAAIRARRLQDRGEFDGADALLGALDVSELPPALRAVIRHTRLSLGWRRSDSATISDTLREITEDAETPELLRDIAQVFIDTSPLSQPRAQLPSVSNRLQSMAARQKATGHDYYAAISLHNAAAMSHNAGSFADAARLGLEALDAYDSLVFTANEKYSLHALLATTSFELGRRGDGDAHVDQATSSDDADGDVFGELALVFAVTGEQSRSLDFLQRAESLDRMGRLDMEGRHQALRARALLGLPRDPHNGLLLLDALTPVTHLDFGANVLATVLRSVALLLLGEGEQAIDIARRGIADAMDQGNGRAYVRLGVVAALAGGSGAEIQVAISRAAASGSLALLEVADAIGANLHAISPVSPELHRSIEDWPKRWRPVLRRQLESGNTANAHIAADLLDQYGDATDVGRLRAFGKTYRRNRRDGVGRALARRLSAPLEIADLGRGSVRVGSRLTPINKIRRKPAQLLMYLVTRPNFTATREQVLEELWPDGDPESGANSLNQSLHFLRRELDPWYEVDVSHDYIAFEAELVWLDNDLTQASSASFLRDVGRMDVASGDAKPVLGLLDRYIGQFCPEFEYDEWAIAWRTRVHAAYLDLAHRGIRQAAALGDLAGAQTIASTALGIDPSAGDIERKLIWVYARSGSDSAASAQYEHLAASMRADGLVPPTLPDILRTPRPA